MLLKLFDSVPLGVQKERTAFFQAAENIVEIDILLLVASDEVGSINEIGGLDRFFAKTKVGNGNPAGFFGIVRKIPLCVKVCFVADDFNRVLVGAHSSIGPKAPEFASDCSFRSCDNLLVYWQ